MARSAGHRQPDRPKATQAQGRPKRASREDGSPRHIDDPTAGRDALKSNASLEPHEAQLLDYLLELVLRNDRET